MNLLNALIDGFAPASPRALLSALALSALLPALSGCTMSIEPFDEPAIVGKVIDGASRAPLPGVMVYGYYVTAEGSLGGGTQRRAVVRSFEMQTNASGEFEIPAWNSGYQFTRGEPRGEFPVISFYKGGYEVKKDAINTLRNWYPDGPEPKPGEVIDLEKLKPIKTTAGERITKIDWRGRPLTLTAVKTEQARYNAIVDAGEGLRYADNEGPCAWEKHVGVLGALHDELKTMIKRTVPPENLDAEGYLNSGDGPVPFANFYARTAVDGLKKAFKTNSSKWRCAIPDTVFAGAK